MKRVTAGLAALFLLAACGQESDTSEETTVEETGGETMAKPTLPINEPTEIAPGLLATVTKNGYGRAAIAGDRVDVHYTGWFYDPEAEDERGDQFDSSRDRGEPLSFPLGARRVIQGWDMGVEGMLIGEQRVLKISPELAYGERGYPGAIPPNSTLIFEVELVAAQGPGE